MSVFEKLLMSIGVFATLVLSPASANSPQPPPPTLEATVKGSDVILVGTVERMFFVDYDKVGESRKARPWAEINSQPPQNAYGGFRVQIRIDRLLYCLKPCPNKKIIYLTPSLNSGDSVRAVELFREKQYIFLLTDRNLSNATTPAEFLGEWRATNWKPC